MVDAMNPTNSSPQSSIRFSNQSIHHIHNTNNDESRDQSKDASNIIQIPKLDDNSFDSEIEDDVSKDIIKADILTLAEVNERQMEHRSTMLQTLTNYAEIQNKNIEDVGVSEDEDDDVNSSNIKDPSMLEAKSLPEKKPVHLIKQQLEIQETREERIHSDPEVRKKSSSNGDNDIIADEIDPVIVDDYMEGQAKEVERKIQQHKINHIPSSNKNNHLRFEFDHEKVESQKVDTTNFKCPFEKLKQKHKKLDLPTLEGYLKKKAPSFLQGYQKRYFKLEDRRLRYYDSEKMEVMLGVINFDLLMVRVETFQDDKKKLKLRIDGANRNFTLKTSDEEETKKWVEAIGQHVVNSDGVKYGSNKKLVLKKNFWKTDRISEARYLQLCDTGDILLFKTKNLGGKIQRTFTRSEYDHVGMILKYSNGEIVLFESTGREGVGLCRWRTFKKNNWHLLYSKMVYRKLDIERTDDMVNKIEKFVKATVGKKYKVSATKLLKKKSDFEEEIRDDQTFFCSELVAACYKRIGLLPKEIPSSSYLPGTFSEKKKKLTLQQNAKLSSEYLIDFSF